MVRRGAKQPENQVRRFPPGRRGTMCITPLASPIHGGGGPRKRWKGLASGDNASYSFLHHSGGTPFGGWRHHLCPGGKHVTGFSGRCASLQHGYHRLTGFSGRCCSPTNPVRWCNSSSFATLLKRGHYGRWTLRSICAWSSSEGKTIQPGFARGNAPLWCLRHKRGEKPPEVAPSRRLLVFITA